MTDIRECVQCHDDFERTPGTNRLRCFKCSPPRITAVPGKGTVSPIRPDPEVTPETYVPPPVPQGPHVPGRHEQVIIREVEELGKTDTFEGVGAIGLAMALDDQWLPGTQRSSMLKQLKILMDELRLTVPAAQDGVDAYADAARRLREGIA